MLRRPAPIYTDRKLKRGPAVPGPNVVPFARREIDVPFDVPTPRLDSAAATYRFLNALNEIMKDPGKTNIARIMALGDAQAADGQTPDTLVAVQVSSLDVFGEVGARPDDSPKGFAFIISGLHAREWMSIEAVVRRLEQFQSSRFADSFSNIDSGTRQPGTRGVFFAENLKIVFLPVVNPGGLRHTQDGDAPTKCFIMENDAASNTVPNPTPPPALNDGDGNLLRGDFRNGRFRRKNMLGVVPVFDKRDDSRRDAMFKALKGVDIGRNMHPESSMLSGSTFVENGTLYRGWGGVAPVVPKATPETKGLYNALDAAFKRLRSPAAPFIDVQGTRSDLVDEYTGAGILDVHTFDNSVSFFETTPSETGKRYERFAKAVFDAAYPGGAGGAKFNPDAKTKGTLEHLGRSVYGVPAATLALPPDGRVDKFYSGGVVIRRVDVDAFVRIRLNLQFLVGADAEFTRQQGIAAAGIDAALDQSTGPPYVRQVLVLKGAPAAGVTWDANKLAPDSPDAEVLYFSQWFKKGDKLTRELSDSLKDFTPAGKLRYLNAEKVGGVAPKMTIVVSFSKPMRDNQAGDPPDECKLRGKKLTDDTTSELDLKRPGVVTALDPLGNGVWIDTDLLDANENLVAGSSGVVTKLGARRYKFDTWIKTVDVPQVDEREGLWEAKLRIALKDQVGFQLDADPSTVARLRDGAYTFYENSDVPLTTDDGGVDVRHGKFQIDITRPKLFKKS